MTPNETFKGNRNVLHNLESNEGGLALALGGGVGGYFSAQFVSEPKDHSARKSFSTLPSISHPFPFRGGIGERDSIFTPSNSLIHVRL